MQIAVFLPIFVFRRKGISNGMKPSREIFLEQTQSRRLGVDVKKHTRKTRGRRARPHPRGTLVALLTDFFHLYISIYPENIETNNTSGVPPPQAYVATKNQSRPCSGTLPEGDPITGGHLHHPVAIHDEEGVVHPWGLRVCTSSYVFDLSLSCS